MCRNKAWSKSSPPKKVSPLVDFTSNTPFWISRIDLIFCHEIGRGFELLAVAETSAVPSFVPSLERQELTVCSSSLINRNLLWGCESCSLMSSLLVASCGWSSLGSCSLLRCYQETSLRSPCSTSYKLIFICNPGESLSSLLGVLPCIMLLWGWFPQALASTLLFCSGLDGLKSQTPITTTKTFIFSSLNFHERLRELSIIQFCQQKREEEFKSYQILPYGDLLTGFLAFFFFSIQIILHIPIRIVILKLLPETLSGFSLSPE